MYSFTIRIDLKISIMNVISFLCPNDLILAGAFATSNWTRKLGGNFQ